MHCTVHAHTLTLLQCETEYLPDERTFEDVASYSSKRGDCMKKTWRKRYA